MKMAKWLFITHLDDEATQEVASLFAESEDVADEVRRILFMLADEDDPRRPRKHPLIVGAMKHEAPGWFRVKVGRYAMRIVFRLAVFEGARLLEVRGFEPIEPHAVGVIDITRAGRHPTVYGKGLRGRYRKLTGR
jgi:hypothetical protein